MVRSREAGQSWRFLVSLHQYNICMGQRIGNVKRTISAFFGGVALCALAGCWQEIEYTGPDPAVTQTTAQPPQETSPVSQNPNETQDVPLMSSADSDATASHFADDLANSMATEPPTLPDVTTPTTTAESSDASVSQADPYALPFEAVEDTESQPAANEIPSLPAEGETTPADDDTTAVEPVETPPEAAESATVTTRLDAWLLGSHWSLAALANDRGVAAENVHKWLESAQQHAATLGVSMGNLPETGAAGDSQRTSRQVLNYLFVQGQQIGSELAKQRGADHAALVEVAVKSNLLRVLYMPGSAATKAISDAIARAAPQAALPKDLWQPLLDLLAANADAAEIRKAVQSFHAEVERHLAPAAEQ
jgi:hypothetical protein